MRQTAELSVSDVEVSYRARVLYLEVWKKGAGACLLGGILRAAYPTKLDSVCAREGVALPAASVAHAA